MKHSASNCSYNRRLVSRRFGFSFDSLEGAVFFSLSSENTRVEERRPLLAVFATILTLGAAPFFTSACNRLSAFCLLYLFPRPGYAGRERKEKSNSHHFVT
eukprot:m.375023 g.375023  ORF g.375023 m.375023 type:complete len:101 (+) comp56174_c1_seq3:1556-1858(+)